MSNSEEPQIVLTEYKRGSGVLPGLLNPKSSHKGQVNTYKRDWTREIKLKQNLPKNVLASSFSRHSLRD
jgi:hypothetical protein